MFFLARSAICIGLVAFMLPATKGPSPWSGLSDTAQAVATDSVQALCTASPEHCGEATIAKIALSGGLDAIPATQRHRSINTLMPADYIPAWAGPAARS